jgi:16S rRNA (cytosine1402-N4)-methyltransferase
LPICICGGGNRKIKKINKKITPSLEELKKNSRSRSAILRVYERI